MEASSPLFQNEEDAAVRRCDGPHTKIYLWEERSTKTMSCHDDDRLEVTFKSIISSCHF